jgi:hypothetical protein
MLRRCGNKADGQNAARRQLATEGDHDGAAAWRGSPMLRQVANTIPTGSIN